MAIRIIVVTVSFFFLMISPIYLSNKITSPVSPAELPADGLELYKALLDQIPEIISHIPCSCCNKMLDWCYKGGCPPT